jgi:DNA-binding transcriptional regulator YiaG
MPRGVWNTPNKNDLRDRIKEIEERIKQLDRREKAQVELKKWLAHRKLTIGDLMAMMRTMKPKRADAPVKSKKPLQPTSGRFAKIARAQEPPQGKLRLKGKVIDRKGDPEFRRAIREARMDQQMKATELAKKIGVSSASVDNWEQGRNVPKDEARLKILKALSLPEHLGAEASQAELTNGRATAP